MDNEERCFGYMECRIVKLTFPPPISFPPLPAIEERGTGEGIGGLWITGKTSPLLEPTIFTPRKEAIILAQASPDYPDRE